jgi:hypothetical protein
LARDPGGYEAMHEEAISRALERLNERIAAAAGALDESEAARTARSMETLRGLVRELDDGQRRLVEQARSNDAGDGPDAGARAPGPRVDANGIGFDPARVGRESRRRAELLTTIADELSLSPRLTREVQFLVDALRSDADRSWTGLTRARVAQIQADRLRRLQSIERALRGGRDPERLSPLATIRAEPAAADREAVARYYRNLSERTPPAFPNDK